MELLDPPPLISSSVTGLLIENAHSGCAVPSFSVAEQFAENKPQRRKMNTPEDIALVEAEYQARLKLEMGRY